MPKKRKSKKTALKTLKLNFKVEKTSYLIALLVIFLVGVTFGSFYATKVDETTSELIMDRLANIQYQVDDFNHLNIFAKSFFSNIWYVFLIWFLGLTLVGIPLIWITVFVKGFGFGFVISFFVREFGIRGIPYALAYTFPQNVIIIPLLIYVSYVAWHFSYRLYVSVFRKSQSKYVSKNFNAYLKLLVYSTLIILVYSFIVIIVSPLVIKLI